MWRRPPAIVFANDLIVSLSLKKESAFISVFLSLSTRTF